MQIVNADPASMLKYELCGYPASGFQCSKQVRPADKPPLAEQLLKLVNQVSDLRFISYYHVFDGGSLLQIIPWKKGTNYLSICNLSQFC